MSYPARAEGLVNSNSCVLTFILLPHLSSSLTDSLPSLNLLCHSKTDAWFVQDAPKAVWSIPCVSVVAFFSSLKLNFIAYRSSKVSWRPDCIFEIHQLWQSGFRRVYSNCCCSCWLEHEIIKIGQSSHKMYSNNLLNFLESTTIVALHPFPQITGRDPAFNPLTAPLGWFGQQMARLICLSAQVVFLIKTADQSLIGVASRWVDGWDRAIKKVKKVERQVSENRTRLCNNNI